MGYWTTSNIGNYPSNALKTSDNAICTDTYVCTGPGDYSQCANASVVPVSATYNKRWDRASRTPIIDYAASDANFSPADYAYFPDLRIFPTIAGAVVPIYNVPELANISTPLVLSRATILGIYSFDIKFWNDSRIIIDNSHSPAIQAGLANATAAIKIVVREDSSGTSSIFTGALGYMSVSFGGTFTQLQNGNNTLGSSTPYWCGGKLTDEYQNIVITGCSTAVSKSITLSFVGMDGVTIYPVTFQCNDILGTLVIPSLAYGSNGYIVTIVSNTSTTTTTVGIGYTTTPLGQGVNMYEPFVEAAGSELTVTVLTVQEGGYTNSPYVTKTKLSEIQSLFINATWATTTGSSNFNITNPNVVGASSSAYLSAAAAVHTDISATILSAINAVTPYAVTSVSLKSNSSWVQYMITFNMSAAQPANPLPLIIQLQDPSALGQVTLNTYQNGNNYPLFYDSAHPQGVKNCGRYFCYRRQDSFAPWSYYTGYTNPGVIAEVISMEYTIGYADLAIANRVAVQQAAMINKAGVYITANSSSTSIAAMDALSYDGKSVGRIADSSSNGAWPFSGFTYFLLRTNVHLGSCEERKATLNFIYNFYTSSAVALVTAALGFSPLPPYIRGLVLDLLVNSITCSDGTYALAQYRQPPITILATNLVTDALSAYLPAYDNVEANLNWNVQSNSDSGLIWRNFTAAPDTVVAAFTIFASKAAKTQGYSSGNTGIITAPFESVAVVPIFKINAFAQSAGATTPITVTAAILAGIYTGTILYWDDPALLAVNGVLGQYLPHERIVVVVRSNPDDVTALFSRYMALQSSHFQQVYSVDPNFGARYFNYTGVLTNFVEASSNGHVPILVDFYDNSIGYFFQSDGAPSQVVAQFCQDSSCSSGVINPSDVNAITVCMDDPNTAYSLPGTNIASYDLMISTAPGCYPIVGTIDFSMFVNANTCPNLPLTATRVRFGYWLYNGPAVLGPLKALIAAGGSTDQRASFATSICNTECNSQLLGFDYCGYRYCTFNDGDYRQVVSTCDPATQLRTVTYVLTDTICIESSQYAPQQDIKIVCDHVELASGLGTAAYFICCIGIFNCLLILFIAWRNRSDRAIRRSQPIFIFIFIVGCLMLNSSIFLFIGENTDTTCLGRPWLVNLSVTIMISPVLLKLHRIDRLFNTRGIKKVKMSDTRVLFQLLCFVLIDVILLIAWTYSYATPKEQLVYTRYNSVILPVSDQICSTDYASSFEWLIVAWQILVLSLGIYKSVKTRNVSAEYSEAKHFAVALYVIGLLGAVAYALHYFVAFAPEQLVFVRCLGIFLCSNIAITFIMGPKLSPAIDRLMGAMDRDSAVVVVSKAIPVAAAPVYGVKEEGFGENRVQNF